MFFYIVLNFFRYGKKELKTNTKGKKNTQKIYVGYSGDDDMKGISKIRVKCER